MTKRLPYREYGLPIEALRQAYSQGVRRLTATDAAVYLDLTLREIGEEWNVDPIQLLKALDDCLASIEQEERQE
jgi:hypothetical protein